MSGLDDWVRRHPVTADALLAVALALVLAPTSVTLVWATDWPLAGRAAILTVLLAAHVTVAGRRWKPLLAYLVCSLAMLALALAPDLTMRIGSELAGGTAPPILLPSALVYVVVLYSVAAWARPPGPTVGLVVGLVGAGLTTVRLSMDGTWLVEPTGQPSGGWRLFVLAALVAAVLAPWGFGRLRLARTAAVEQDRTDRAERAVTAERSRIAREMHDVVAHSLAVIVRQAEGGRFAAAKDPRLAAEALSTVATTGRQALADMRGVLGRLHQDEPTDTAPQPTVEDLPALVERVRRTGLPVELTTTGSARPLDRAVSLAAYRVVQEALTNVVKHAGQDATAGVRVDWSGGDLRVEVADDGAGPPSPAGAGEGHGLAGMRERVSLAGGRLAAGPRPGSAGRGFAVEAVLPTRRGLDPT